jgi:hypothetical protein
MELTFFMKADIWLLTRIASRKYNLSFLKANLHTLEELILNLKGLFSILLESYTWIANISNI